MHCLRSVYFSITHYKYYSSPIDYVYTADGKLKAINHANKAHDPGQDGVSNGFAPDVFGMNLEYHSGDYKRSGRNISSIQSGSTAQHYSGLINGTSRKESSSSLSSHLVQLLDDPADNNIIHSRHNDVRFICFTYRWFLDDFDQ